MAEVAFESTNKVIIDLAQQVVDLQKNYLVSKGKVASGDLVNSIGYEIATSANGMKVQFLADPQWIYVEKGREAGARFPPPQPIANWMREKRIRPRDGISMEQAVFLISRKIHLNGIKPTPFVEYSQQTLEQNIDKSTSLLEAFEKDVLNSIPNEIKA